MTATFTAHKSPLQASVGDTAEPISIDIAAGAASTDYEGLRNKPQINGVTLIGNKTPENFGAHALTNMEILTLIHTAKGL